MKKITISSIIVIALTLTGSQMAFAASSVLSVLPLLGSSTVGTSFNISVQINSAGNNVCVVKGTINFDKLTCQSITLANGLMAQTVPTCAAPNFTVGIPKCTSVSENLFSVSVSGNEVGQANISFTGVKVIGAGTDVPFSSESGVYNISSVVQPEISTTIASTITTTSTPAENTVTNAVTPDTGLQIPSGVGEFGATSNNVENLSTTSSSSVATTSTSANNGLVATVLEGFTNIPNKAM